MVGLGAEWLGLLLGHSPKKLGASAMRINGLTWLLANPGFEKTQGGLGVQSAERRS